MSKKLVKLVIWAGLAVVSAVSLWFVLSGISNLLAYFRHGADPASALNIVPNVPPDLHVAVTWLADDEDTGRKMEPFERAQVEAAYIRAWLQWNISYLRGEPYGLKTYFTGPALAAAGDAVQKATAEGVRVSQADIEHTLKLHFYAADGSIISFTDTRAVVAQSIRTTSGSEIYAGETQARYDVVLFLEDGNWRVRHWLRTDGATLAASVQPAQRVARKGFVAQDGTSLTLDGQPYHIAGVNYYPQNTPWDKFWTSYDGAIIDHDFGLIQSLGLNTVRIFVPFEQFGGPKVDPIMIGKLDDLLRHADAHGLKVIVTLFDFRSDYSLLLWPSADRQLEALLTHYADNPTILAWDLKNEPDRDYSFGRKTVDAWLIHTSRLAHGYDPNHLVTIGWSTSEAAHMLPGSDFVSFHYYAPASRLASEYTRLRAAIPDRPIVLTEFGLPTWNSPFFPNGHTEPEQAEYYADVMASLRTTDSSGYLAWTLYDFESVPSSVAGRLPWQSEPQKYMGVIGMDGKPKRAAALLAQSSSLSVTRVPSWARFLKPFWLLVFFLVALFSTVTVRRVKTMR